MVLQFIDQLNQQRVVLASSSPRRLSILHGIGLRHIEVVPSGVDENLDKTAFGSGAAYATATAREKADDVLARLCCAHNEGDGKPPAAFVIAADTVVTLDGAPLTILGKASDVADARAMLQRLSGRAHEVSTGVVIYHRRTRSAEAELEADGTEAVRRSPPIHVTDYTRHSFAVVTRVYMLPLSDALLDAYLAVPSYWQGKAGAYGIQDGAGCFISGIDGDYYNVMGLPLSRLGQELCRLITEVDDTDSKN